MQAEEETRNFLKTSIKNYYASGNETNAVTLMWDHLQAQLSCCGVDNYKDFQHSEKWVKSGKTIPESCCVLDDKTLFKQMTTTCNRSPNESNSYYMKVRYKFI